MRSAISATTPRSWVTKRMAIPSSDCRRRQQVEHLSLDGDVERGRGLVGDQQLGVASKGHGDHDPLAHATRQRVRVVVQAPAGVGDTDQIEHVQRTRRAAFVLETDRWTLTASTI